MLPAVLLGACLIALAVLGVRYLMGRRVAATDRLAFGARSRRRPGRRGLCSRSPGERPRLGERGGSC
jgi:hypothetical protein